MIYIFNFFFKPNSLGFLLTYLLQIIKLLIKIITQFEFIFLLLLIGCYLLILKVHLVNQLTSLLFKHFFIFSLLFEKKIIFTWTRSDEFIGTIWCLFNIFFLLFFSSNESVVRIFCEGYQIHTHLTNKTYIYISFKMKPCKTNRQLAFKRNIIT